MTKRIFNSIWTVTLCVLLTASLIFLGILYSYFTSIEQDRLRMETDVISQGVNLNGEKYFDNLKLDNLRITWIDKSGKVLFDNQIEKNKLDNHIEREEIRESLEIGKGESIRYSDTLTERYFYSARKLDDGSVIRLSIAENSIVSLVLGMLQPLCVVLFIALILSLFIASRVAKKIVEPLNELNLENPLDNKEYDELSPLLRRILHQQNEIKTQNRILSQKTREFDSVTTHMPEGIILLNKDLHIISINASAERILGEEHSCVGSYILSVCRDVQLNDLLQKSLKGKHGDVILTFHNRKYQFKANPVIAEDAVSGIAVLITDVTEKEELDQIKREFTANVSHELRTPLHTISGCAELMKSGMVKEEDMNQFSSQIYTESQRMIKMVEDIIQLSRLDEGAVDFNYAETDLYETAHQVVNALSLKAEENNIKLELNGEPAVIKGVPGLLYEIIYNLCDNAIKYNHNDGMVYINVKPEKELIKLTVSDTGIGIPAEHLDRIFERFYRVDKSHSKETGGTGLGLSIVKHAVKIHNGSIRIKSEPGVGTSFEIELPIV